MRLAWSPGMAYGTDPTPTRMVADRIPLTHRSEPRITDGRRSCGWSLPGGGLEPCETPVRTVVGEAHEESRYAVSVGAPMGVSNSFVASERDDGRVGSR